MEAMQKEMSEKMDKMQNEVRMYICTKLHTYIISTVNIHTYVCMYFELLKC